MTYLHLEKSITMYVIQNGESTHFSNHGNVVDWECAACLERVPLVELSECPLDVSPEDTTLEDIMEATLTNRLQIG